MGAGWAGWLMAELAGLAGLAGWAGWAGLAGLAGCHSNKNKMTEVWVKIGRFRGFQGHPRDYTETS